MVKLRTKRVFGNKNANVYDYIIALFTLSNRSHSEIEFSDGTWWSSSYHTGTRFIKGHSYGKDYTTIELPNVDEEKLYQICMKYNWLKYDRKGAILVPFNVCFIRLIVGFIFRQDERKLFCSEAVALALLEEGTFNIDELPCKYAPHELENELKEKA